MHWVARDYCRTGLQAAKQNGHLQIHLQTTPQRRRRPLIRSFAVPLAGAWDFNPHVRHRDKTPGHSVAPSRVEAPAGERKTL